MSAPAATTATANNTADCDKKEQPPLIESPSWNACKKKEDYDRIPMSPCFNQALAPGHAFVASAAAKNINFKRVIIRRMFVTDGVLASFGIGSALLAASFIPPVRTLLTDKINDRAVTGTRIGGAVLSLGAVVYAAARYFGFKYKLKQNARKELDPAPDVRRDPHFRDKELIEKATGYELYKEAYTAQPKEGWCGAATVLTVLRSTPEHVKMYPVVASKPEPLDQEQIAEMFRRSYGAEKVKILSAPFTLEEFTEIVRRSGDKRYRITVNWLRQPCFYNDPKYPASEATGDPHPLMQNFSGHFSIVAGTVVAPDNGVEYVLVLDVNEKYGRILIPVESLWRGTNTRSFYSGEERGFVQVEL